MLCCVGSLFYIFLFGFEFVFVLRLDFGVYSCLFVFLFACYKLLYSCACVFVFALEYVLVLCVVWFGLIRAVADCLI